MILVSCMHMIGLEIIFAYELVQVLYLKLQHHSLSSFNIVPHKQNT
jgi:hypothetical protein